MKKQPDKPCSAQTINMNLVDFEVEPIHNLRQQNKPIRRLMTIGELTRMTRCDSIFNWLHHFMASFFIYSNCVYATQILSSNYNCYRSVDFSGNSNIRNSDHHRRPRGCPALSLSCISSGQPSQLTLLTNLKLIRNYINQLLSFVPTKFNSSGAQLQLGGQEIGE